MNSRRPNRSCLLAPLDLTRSGKAAFSLEKALPFLEWNSNAGTVASNFWQSSRHSSVNGTAYWQFIANARHLEVHETLSRQAHRTDITGATQTTQKRMYCH
jgi:hypothetical protein